MDHSQNDRFLAEKKIAASKNIIVPSKVKVVPLEIDKSTDMIILYSRVTLQIERRWCQIKYMLNKGWWIARVTGVDSIRWFISPAEKASLGWQKKLLLSREKKGSHKQEARQPMHNDYNDTLPRYSNQRRGHLTHSYAQWLADFPEYREAREKMKPTQLIPYLHGTYN